MEESMSEKRMGKLKKIMGEGIRKLNVVM